MNAHKSDIFLLVLLGLLFGLLFSCQNQKISLHAEAIFSIPLGIMRDEINLFSRKNFLYNESSSFTLTPLGSYFIADRSSRKVFYYTNYGKLNYIIYNPKYRYDSDIENPKYLDKAWPFGQISQIAASLKKLYVASTLNGKNTGDPNNLYAQVILTFNNKGDFLYQLGTQGRGQNAQQTAFRYRVIKLFIDAQGNLFTVLRKPQGYHIYHFSDKGRLIGNFELSVNHTILQDKNLQSKINKEKNIFFEIIAPHFSYDGQSLFFELYSYAKKINDANFKIREIKAYQYDIYSIEVDRPYQTLQQHFTVREFDAERQEIKQTYGEQLIGTTSNGLLAFLQVYPNDNNVLVYRDQAGNKKYIVSIDINPNISYKLYLAPNGLVSALNFYEDQVQVTWWRTDKLIDKEFYF